jgi:hypothetical protein
MSAGRTVPPGGAAAPTDVEAPDGGTVDVRALAQAVCERYREEFPDERERYGDAGHRWCVHDNQYLIHWAILDLQGATAIGDQVGWLARVLHARDFPLDRLRRDLEIAADVVEESGRPWSQEVADRLRGAREAVTADARRP